MSEKFLIKFFGKLKPADFKRDKFLLAFYRFYRKEKSDNLFECYIEYITRNWEYKGDERELNLRRLYDDIRGNIIEPVKSDRPNVTYKSAYTEDVQPEKGEQVTKVSKGVISKTKALDVLSDFIKQSFIITYEDPDKEYDEKDEAFMEQTTSDIIDDIRSDGRSLPEPKKDAVFGQRSDMLNIWQNTRKRCQVMMENEQLHRLFSKIFYIDSSKLTSVGSSKPEAGVASKPEAGVSSRPVKSEKRGIFATQDEPPQNVTQTSAAAAYSQVAIKPVRQQTLSTVLLTGDDGSETILPVENFIACYSDMAYNTVITLSNNHPLQEVVNQVRQKNKSIYICSGSQNICGGNADQGMDVAESMLYMTSSYSISLERALHAFPLKSAEIILCPNVLVFKDTEYNFLETNLRQKIAVLNMPCKYKPRTSLKDPPQDECMMDPRLYDARTEMSAADYDKIKTTFVGSVEAALFFGYDTIIVDDLSVSDNWLPVYQIAKIIREVTHMFKGRVREFIVCANRAKSFNVLKLYI